MKPQRRKKVYSTPPKKKSAAQQFQEDIIFMIVGAFIIYIITGIFKLIFYPFRYMLMTNDQIDAEEIKKAKEKVEDRRRRCVPDSDPLVQYRERFIRNADKYADDPNNEKYLEWYKEWKAGHIRDTKLYWIPDIYIERQIFENPFEKKYMNPEFLNYFEFQYNLHKDKWALRSAFLNTVRHYFPEFTPTAKDIESDIAELKNRSNEKHLRYQIYDEIKKSLEKITNNSFKARDIAKELAVMDISGNEIKEVVEKIKKGVDYGFDADIVLYMIKRDLDFDPEIAEAIKGLKENFPFCDFIIDAYFDREINNDDAKRLLIASKDARDTYGEKIFRKRKYSDKIRFVEEMEREFKNIISEHKREKLEKETGDKAWK